MSIMRASFGGLAFAWLATTAWAAPERIVIAGGSLTEIVYALGAQDRIVGVDLTSLYPAEATALPQIGYYRQLAAEGILSLAPDLVLVSSDAGPPATLDQIRAAGIPVTVVEEHYTPAGIAAKVRAVGAALERPDAAEALALAVESDLQAVEDALPPEAERPSAIFVLGLSSGAPLVAGGGTAADAAIALAGGRNAFHDVQGYKPGATEAIVAAQPDWIVFAEHAAQPVGGTAELAALPAFAGTDAARQGRIVIVDALYLLGMGPRTPLAIRDLAATMHPGWAAPTLPERAWAAP
jgi:iron complex transport system substrate-binding protein